LERALRDNPRPIGPILVFLRRRGDPSGLARGWHLPTRSLFRCDTQGAVP